MALLQLEKKFGSLSDKVKQQIEAMAPDELRRIMLEFPTAQSLKELHLEE